MSIPICSVIKLTPISMKAILTSIPIILLFTLAGLSQEKNFREPDYQKIKQQVNNKDSEFFYPKLFERYQGNDTTLQHKHYRMLYYGYPFQPGYQPSRSSPYSDSLRTIYQKDSLKKADFDKIIEYEQRLLEKDPFSLRDLNTLAYAYAQKNEKQKTTRLDYKINLLIETILSTGDGLKEESAWHVTEPSHEQDILNVLGFQPAGEESMRGGGFDYIRVKENRYDIDGFYFNVSQVIKKQQQE